MENQALAPSASAPAELELAELLVATLNLEVAPKDIDPTAPLFREGLGLDSIDILELSLAISKKYGVKVRADDEQNAKIFGSLRALTEHIRKHQAQ